MADEKLTALTEETTPTSDDLIYLVDDPDGSPASRKTTLGSGIMNYGVCQGRLTLTSNTPVTTSDVSSATGTYYTPYVGDQIGLYNSSGTWSVLQFTETYLSLNGYTASKPYDIFAYHTTGTLALESLIWTNATTRATALTYQDGILVKSGDATRRYLGTIYINSTGGQTEDTLLQRFVWNMYNQESRMLQDAYSSTHTYTTASWRAWNNSTTLGSGRVEFVMGLAKYIMVWVQGRLQNPVGAGIYTGRIGAGLNRTNSSEVWSAGEAILVTGQFARQSPSGKGIAVVTEGFNYINATQIGNATSASYSDIAIGADLFG